MESNAEEFEALNEAPYSFAKEWHFMPITQESGKSG